MNMKIKSVGTAIIVILVLLSTFALSAPYDENFGDLEIIRAETLILDWIRRAYVDSISNSELYQGAIDGIIKKLDPHSSFLFPERAQDFNEKLRGNFQGIGITFAIINKKITVIEAIKGGPSEIAGLMARDKIVKIENENVIGISEDSVKTFLRGPKGTEVRIHVERPGEEKLLRVTITRDTINMNSVSHAYMIDDKTGYLALTQFTINTPEDVADALKKLKSLGMKQLIFDLRGNTGGSLDAAVSVVKFFITNGTIVYTEGKREIDYKTWVAKPTKYPAYTDIPMIIMTNHGTASASEIVSGALQDHDRALIIGQTSFGKGLVMNPFPLRNNFENKPYGTLMLSVARYYTPSSRLIQRPYENGREEYIKEGFDDVDPNAADSTKAGKPVYYTDLGRKVYGGGGITPDIPIDRPKNLNPYEAALRNSYVFFEFTDDYLVRHTDIPDNFVDFLLHYRIPETEIEQFREFAIGRGITNGDDKPLRKDFENLLKKEKFSQESIDKAISAVKESGVDTDETLFERSADFIERGIKQEMARMIWGPEARYRVIHTGDMELITTLSYFTEAKELLERRLAIGGL